MSQTNTSPKPRLRESGLRAFPHNLAQDFQRNKVIYLLCIPIVIWYIIFCYLPMGGLVMSFEQFSPAKGIFGSKWVGLKNFEQFFTGPFFFRTLRNTAMIGLLELLFSFPMPILFALLLNEVHHIRFKKVVQTISYMPYFISMVVICGIIKDFTESNGVISNLVAAISGGKAYNLLGNSANFRAIYIISSIWQTFGYGSIIYLAAIAGVDQALYEAAVVDGAGRWRQTVHITIPEIMPTVIILLILKMGTLLAVGAEKILLLYSPATYETADVISTYVYREGLQNFNYGYSTAVGLFNSFINTALLLGANFLSRKYSETSLF
ncbi:MAG TPA: ABC transporter permease subunit [Candidatus Limiplasma sp.]|nr:ABC transporter permease subunit [Candidatus Limiplasma sp.]